MYCYIVTAQESFPRDLEGKYVCVCVGGGGGGGGVGGVKEKVLNIRMKLNRNFKNGREGKYKPKESP